MFSYMLQQHMYYLYTIPDVDGKVAAASRHVQLKGRVIKGLKIPGVGYHKTGYPEHTPKGALKSHQQQS